LFRLDPIIKWLKVLNLYLVFVLRTTRPQRSEKSRTDPDENHQLFAGTHHVQHVRFAAQVLLLLETTCKTDRVAFTQRAGAPTDILPETGRPGARPTAN